MHCPECETFEQLVYSSTDIYFSFPLDHSQAKFNSYIGRSKLPFERSVQVVTKITISRAAIGKFLTELSGVLTDEEQAATKVLTLPAGTKAGLEQFGRVTTLERVVAAHQAAWIEDLLSNGRFKSLFQPMFDAISGEATAVEALFRGIDENGDLISPGFMFRLAQRARMMFQTDLVARRSAVTQAAGAGLQRLQLFINFNPTSIYDPSYCLRTTVSTIEQLGFRPENIVFEVTESERVTNQDHLRGILAFYRRSGFKVALDDVGSGYSGLNLLRDLRPDYIKIDMHLVRDVDRDAFRQSIVRHIIAIAREAGIKIVAEGIETSAELQWLRRHNVDLLQGYALARPMAAEQVLTLRHAA